ncbi:hypothetical protein [Legionella tucsonensis]|uniref:Uncharacterized protein n=1 Tax=Legionella tucsonensis TaxID=40335 RepID=A0A0W0ZZ61_9GAMM|nr:hypothetical protein [Legionella tucsonensis]KTD74372.1 hypothetical protein Ltuc_2219 [Legionella tucsonensis]
MTPAKELLIITGCINLSSWIPNALLEHKIRYRLVFGKGDKVTQKKNISEAEQSNTPNKAFDELQKPQGHGRLPPILMQTNIYSFRRFKTW